MTNKGLRFAAVAKRVLECEGGTLPEGTFAVALNCYYRASRRRHIILLLSVSEASGSYIRIRSEAGPEAIDEMLHSRQWDDVGLMEFYVR